jgi:hypothetical protein
VLRRKLNSMKDKTGKNPYEKMKIIVRAAPGFVVRTEAVRASFAKSEQLTELHDWLEKEEETIDNE